jgi:hypothetical protein
MRQDIMADGVCGIDGCSPHTVQEDIYIYIYIYLYIYPETEREREKDSFNNLIKGTHLMTLPLLTIPTQHSKGFITSPMCHPVNQTFAT